MINSDLHKNVVALDRVQHKGLKIQLPLTDWSMAKGLNSYFITTAEFGDLCKDFPIVFVRNGDDAANAPLEVAPVAVYGLQPGENLFIKDGKWVGESMPAHMRAYPFATAKISDEQYAICVDRAWAGFDNDAGEALFDDKGEAAPFLDEIKTYLDNLEVETERTRLICKRLVELDLMEPMRFDAQLDSGNLSVEGFFCISETKFTALAGDVVAELHRNGILGLVHAQHVSMGNMRRLVERRVRQAAA